MKKWMIFLTVVLIGKPCHANLFSNLREVYETNPEILTQRQLVESSKAGVSLAKTGWQPSVGASAGIARTRTKLMGTNYDETQKQLGISITQNIFHGFSTSADINASKAFLESEQANLYATEQNVFLEAVNAYIAVLNAREVLKLNQNNEKVLHEYYDLYVQKEQVGVLTQTDVAQASARFEWAKYQVIDAKARYDNTLETFRRIYGKPNHTYDDINLEHLESFFPKTLKQAEETALLTHPAIKAALAKEKAYEEKITIAKQTYLPSLDIKASALKYDDIPLIDEVTDKRIGVYLSVPLYDKGTASAHTRMAKANASAMREQTVQIRRTVLEKLHQAWNSYEAQGAAIQSARIRIKASRLALAGVKDEQERGRRTVLDVLNAEQEVLDAQVALTQAKHNRISAYFTVLSGTGQLTAENLGLTEKP